MHILKHIAIIMDDEQCKKNKPRTYGHQHGAKNIKNIIEIVLENKIEFLTLFAFSCENWNRPKKEVFFLIKLIDNKLNSKTLRYLNKHNISLK
jgi:undecaprenyl diphosphate synthase